MPNLFLEFAFPLVWWDVFKSSNRANKLGSHDRDIVLTNIARKHLSSLKRYILLRKDWNTFNFFTLFSRYIFVVEVNRIISEQLCVFPSLLFVNVRIILTRYSQPPGHNSEIIEINHLNHKFSPDSSADALSPQSSPWSPPSPSRSPPPSTLSWPSPHRPVGNLPTHKNFQSLIGVDFAELTTSHFWTISNVTKR